MLHSCKFIVPILVQLIYVMLLFNVNFLLFKKQRCGIHMKFSQAPIGALAPGSVHARSYSHPPINTKCQGGGANLFCGLKPHAKFGKPTITPSGRKVTQGEEEEEKHR
jgi:hypothetical protein